MKIHPSATGGARSIAAEILVGQHLETMGHPGVEVLGGRTRGHDVTTTDGMLVDVKVLVPMSDSERRDYPDCTWKLRTRDDQKHYDAGRATHLAFVAYSDDSEVVADVSTKGLTLHVSYDEARIALATLADVNALLSPGLGWSYLFIEDEWLEERWVHPAYA